MKVVIIGCTHAGTAAAKNIRELHPKAQITIYERNATVSFLSCGIALHVSGVVKNVNDLFYSSPQALAELGIDVRMRHDVVEVDLQKKSLVISNLDQSKTFTDTFDKLVVTTGSWPVVPPLEGTNLDGVLLSKNFDHAKLIDARQKKTKHVTVLGGGYIGIELVEAFLEQGKKVTLVDKAPRIFCRYFDKEFSDIIEKELVDHGVTLALSQGVVRFQGDNGKLKAVVTEAGSIPTEMAILCIGFRPNTELFRGKLATLGNGAIIVDDYMRTSFPDVFAAGDCCAVTYNPTGSQKYIPLATNAVRMGTLVARNLVRLTTPSSGTQGTSAIKIFGHCLGATGMTAETARDEGFDAESVTIADNDRPEFMPDYTKVTLKLTYEKKSGRLLGGQIHSTKDMSQMMNTLSLAIQKQMTVSELAFSDFFFLPHFNKPWSLLNIAALQTGR